MSEWQRQKTEIKTAKNIKGITTEKKTIIHQLEPVILNEELTTALMIWCGAPGGRRGTRGQAVCRGAREALAGGHRVMKT